MSLSFFMPFLSYVLCHIMTLKRMLAESAVEKYKNNVQMFLPVLMDGLTNLLNNTPVYTLDETKTKEALVKKFGKVIIVEKGTLRLETSLF